MTEHTKPRDMPLTPDRSDDAILRRAVSRMCAANANGDWAYIARIHEKARNMRANRSANAFLDSLRRPHDVKRWRLEQYQERNSNTSRIAAE